MLGHYDQPVEREHFARGNDGFIHGYGLTVARFHLVFHDWVRQIEVAEFLESSDRQPESAIVDFPYQFGTVYARVGPLKGQVVRLPLELSRHLPELRDGFRRQDAVSIP